MNTTATAMSSLESLFAQPLVNAVGWALVHFVWQGAAVAAIVAVLLAVLRRASANVRYLVACVALLVLACMPIATAWCVFPQPPTRPKMSNERAENLLSPSTETDGARGAPLPQDFVELPFELDSPPVATASLVNPSSPPARPLRARAAEWIEHGLPWLVAAWLVGVLGLSARLLAGWAHVQRIRRRHARPAAEPWPARLAELARRLRVTRPVRLLESAVVEVPIVIGWLRPAILLPVSALVGLTPHQLEALLAHELAHIRRQDYLVNLLQTIVETLLFYHPAVWWVSHRIRAEREECCDDLAVSVCGDRVVYARALATMEELRSEPVRLAVAAGGGSLLRRISRLLGRTEPAANRSGWWLAGLITLAALFGSGLGLKLNVRAEPADKTAEQSASDDNSLTDAPRGNADARSDAVSLAMLRAADNAVDAVSQDEESKAEAAPGVEPQDEGPRLVVESGIHVGATLSAERQAALIFGPTAENGLCAAWSRYPARETYLAGDFVDSSVVIRNASEAVIEFKCPYSLDAIVNWNARADGGRQIEAKKWRYTGTIPLRTWRLKPGEFMEIYGRLTMIGEGERREGVDAASMATVLLAKRGENVSVEWKLSEPVEMTTGEVSFKVAGIEDVPVWSTSQDGRWPMSGGVTLEVKQENVHATDIMSTAILTWPMDKAGGTARHQIWLGGDFFTNRDPWLLAWERGATVLWAMSGQMQSSQDFHKVMPTPSSFRQIDFSNPKKITETSWSYIPDLVPDAIRAEFAKGFLPLAATPRTPAHAKPSVISARAEDVRPVKELLSGAWKSAKGYMDVRITFPERPTDEVKWTMTFERPQGNAIVSESLAPMDSPQDGSVRLTKPRRQPRTPGAATLGRLKRGIGDTLLLDIMPHVDFPEYERANGIVLQRVSAPVQPETQKPKAEVPGAGVSGVESSSPQQAPQYIKPEKEQQPPANYATSKQSYNNHGTLTKTQAHESRIPVRAKLLVVKRDWSNADEKKPQDGIRKSLSELPDTPVSRAARVHFAEAGSLGPDVLVSSLGLPSVFGAEDFASLQSWLRDQGLLLGELPVEQQAAPRTDERWTSRIDLSAAHVAGLLGKWWLSVDMRPASTRPDDQGIFRVVNHPYYLANINISRTQQVMESQPGGPRLRGVSLGKTQKFSFYLPKKRVVAIDWDAPYTREASQLNQARGPKVILVVEDAEVPEPRSTTAAFRLPERIGSLYLDDERRWLSPPGDLADIDQAVATELPEPARDESSQEASQKTSVEAAERATPPADAKLPGRLFVNAGLHTKENEGRLFQSAIAIDPNTGSWTRLQTTKADGFTWPISPVRVSPDGRTMLFMREKKIDQRFEYELWKCDARTGDGAERFLEKGSPTAWSPDGKSVVVVVPKGESPYLEVENWLVNADTRNHSVLTLPNEDAVEDWSPDGQWLVVVSRKAGQISLVKPDGSGRRRITAVADSDSFSDPRPRISPDSRRIVYLRVHRSGEEDARTATFSLHTINIDGTDDRKILGDRQVDSTSAPTIWTSPLTARWSPDGKHLAVVLFDHTRSGGVAALGGNWRLAIIDADGGNLRELRLEGVLNMVLPWDGPEWRAMAPPADPTPE